MKQKTNIYMVPVQFITHTTPSISYEQSAYLALEGGCRWIQLRMKDGTDAEVMPVAERVREACKKAEAVFVVDDRVEVALAVGADGVHLGKEDMPIREAREKVGHEMLIGATANTADDILRLAKEGADYIGCGPFRYTETKKKLAPVIGLEGYSRIMKEIRERGLRIPVCAIGGIELADVMPILETGVSGIAVSGTILRADNPVEAMKALLNADAL